jgi:hypothetical protein
MSVYRFSVVGQKTPRSFMGISPIVYSRCTGNFLMKLPCWRWELEGLRKAENGGTNVACAVDSSCAASFASEMLSARVGSLAGGLNLFNTRMSICCSQSPDGFLACRRARCGRHVGPSSECRDV